MVGASAPCNVARMVASPSYTYYGKGNKTMARKTTQIMSLNCFGRRFKVIFHHDTERNPFWLYEIKWAVDKTLHYCESKKLVAKYQNFESCLYTLAQSGLPEFRKDVF